MKYLILLVLALVTFPCIFISFLLAKDGGSHYLHFLWGGFLITFVLIVCCFFYYFAVGLFPDSVNYDPQTEQEFESYGSGVPEGSGYILTPRQVSDSEECPYAEVSNADVPELETERFEIPSGKPLESGFHVLDDSLPEIGVLEVPDTHDVKVRFEKVRVVMEQQELDNFMKDGMDSQQVS